MQLEPARPTYSARWRVQISPKLAWSSAAHGHLVGPRGAVTLSALAARWWSVPPRRIHIEVPLMLVAGLYWASSLPGVPSPDDPAIYGVFLWLPPTLQNALHVPAYSGLTLAWRWALRAWLRTSNACALAACAIALVCGVLDEWNQSFVPGRFASLTDIVLNGVGVALAIWLAAWIESRAAVNPG